VVEPTSGDVAGLGSTVVVDDDGSERTYHLVGATEASPGEGKLSIEAPLARSLLGARAGDVVDFQAPKGARSLRVVSVK
jgi:transcription elongation factor GreA